MRLVYDAPVSPRCILIALGIAALPGLATAEPCPDASALRADLEQESVRADHWNLAWRIAHSALAAGQLAVAASGAADRDNTRALWVGGAESALGALGAWLMPLRIDVPSPTPTPTGDACADRAALRGIAERAASDERRMFWASHLGGLVVSVAGGVVVAELTSWRNGLVSFATSYAVGLLNTYTMPRASWRRTREPTWTASVVANGDHRALVVGGSF
jgi:hypothetical protein